MGGLFSFIAIVVLFVMVMNLRGRLKRAEDILAEAAKRIGALQRQAGLQPATDRQADTPPATVTAGDAAASAHPSVRPNGDESSEGHPVSTVHAPPAAADHERWKPVAPVAPLVPASSVTDRGPAPVAVSPPAAEAPRRAAALAPRAPVIAQSSDGPSSSVRPASSPDVPEPLSGAASAPPPAPPLVPPPAPPPAPPLVPPPVPPRSAASRFENLFGKTLPIWAGGITLAIAGVLIVKYAVDAGFFARIFTHGVQIISGLLFGLGLIGGAELAWRYQDRVRDLRVPQALSGAGIATLYASILVAANVYQLIGPLLAFAALAAITAGALGLSLRFGAPSALLGLAGGLAAPALVGTMEPNVPLLAVYLGLTIAGLTGVSRMRRWPWLALAALIGGVGWSLWMVLASNALDVMGSLSIGGFVMLLAIALPMLAFDGPRANTLRAGSALVGAVQLALLVGYGGFIPLHWGLFALLAAAGQWLAWRNSDFAIVPTISAGLSVMLLAVWPDPASFWFVVIGLSLVVIHAAPLLLRLWQTPPNLQHTLEYCGIAIVAPILTKWQFPSAGDALLASVAMGGAALTGVAIIMGWRASDRQADARFAWLTTASAALIALAIALILPLWLIALGIGVVAVSLLFFGKIAADIRIEPIAAGFAGVAIAALGMTVEAPVELGRLWFGAMGPFAAQALIRWAGMAALLALFAAKAADGRLRLAALAIAGVTSFGAVAQIIPGWSLVFAMGGVAAALFALSQRRDSVPVERLSLLFAAGAMVWLLMTGPELVQQWTRLTGSDAPVTILPALRWGGLALLALLYMIRSPSVPVRRVAQIAGAFLVYATAAQLVPGGYLMLVPAIAGAGTVVGMRRVAADRIGFAAVTFVLLTLAWAFAPLAVWLTIALTSLAGVPMWFDGFAPQITPVLLRLLIPLLLLSATLYSARDVLAERTMRLSAIIAGVVAVIVAHSLYRIGFAQLMGDMFVAVGLGERLVLAALLLGAGWLALRRGLVRMAMPLALAAAAHLMWYSMVLHNPLWAAQAVGPWPVVNLLAPLFGLTWIALTLVGRTLPNRGPWFDRGYQLMTMALIGGFGWATLRQLFHGTLLVDPGVVPMENILRSLLILALAIGFLLWGIRARRHDWRIASLVLMLGAVAKVFLFDASGLEGLLRIGSFIALGFSLIGIGWLYSRQLGRSDSGEQTTDATPSATI